MIIRRLFLLIALLLASAPAHAGQAPFAASAPNFPVSGQDRVYAAEQFSNTVSVIDPSTNRNLGVIRLGDPQPMNLSPLYKGQVLVHGLGFSPDRKTLVVVSIASNSVTFIDTATNRSSTRPMWDARRTRRSSRRTAARCGSRSAARITSRFSTATTYAEKRRITVPNGPGMTIFSPDGRYGYVCSSFTPETVVISTHTYEIVGRVKQISPFCPNIAASPDGKQVWLTLKDIGKVMVFSAKPPFRGAAGDRHRADHQPRQFCEHAARTVRLCDGGRAEPGEGLSDRRLSSRSRRLRSAICRMASGRRETGRASMSASRTAMR